MERKDKGIIEQPNSTDYSYNNKLSSKDMESVYKTKKFIVDGKIKINCFTQYDTYTIRWKDKYMDSKEQSIRFEIDTLKELAETIREDDFDHLTIIM